MPHRFKGERTLMRIFIGESDKYQGKPLYEALLEKLRAKGLAGATVLRGVAGFGASSVVHTDKILRLSLDLPLIIEVVETEETIQSILPDLDEMIGGGLITLERARVILYRPANVRASEQEQRFDRARRRESDRHDAHQQHGDPRSATAVDQRQRPRPQPVACQPENHPCGDEDVAVQGREHDEDGQRGYHGATARAGERR